MSDYNIDFAVFCDGPLNSYLANDNDELYASYVENVETYGHCKDISELDTWLQSGLNPTIALNHIIEIFVKNYKTYNRHKHTFRTFTIHIIDYGVDISQIIHCLMSFDNIDDYYPCYFDEYKEMLIIRMDILDYLYLVNSTSEFISKVKEYADWKSIPVVSSTNSIEINIDNFMDVYFTVMKSHSVILKAIK